MKINFKMSPKGSQSNFFHKSFMTFCVKTHQCFAFLSFLLVIYRTKKRGEREKCEEKSLVKRFHYYFQHQHASAALDSN